MFLKLYQLGKPIQYSYLNRDLNLEEVQTPYAGRPVAVEMPSAGRPLGEGLRRALKTRGVKIHTLTHAAGISATGDPQLDARLPLPEWYHLPEKTLHGIIAAKNRGNQVVAVGTSVVRAIEGCQAERGGLWAGEGETALILGPGFKPQWIDGVISGFHAPGESHFQLLSCFASPEQLTSAYHDAEQLGFVRHEFGDTWLILPN